MGVIPSNSVSDTFYYIPLKYEKEDTSNEPLELNSEYSLLDNENT